MAPPKLYPAQRSSPRLKFQKVRITHEMNQAIRGALSGIRTCPTSMLPPSIFPLSMTSLISIIPVQGTHLLDLVLIGIMWD